MYFNIGLLLFLVQEITLLTFNKKTRGKRKMVSSSKSQK